MSCLLGESLRLFNIECNNNNNNNNNNNTLFNEGNTVSYTNLPCGPQQSYIEHEIQQCN